MYESSRNKIVQALLKIKVDNILVGLGWAMTITISSLLLNVLKILIYHIFIQKMRANKDDIILSS